MNTLFDTIKEEYNSTGNIIDDITNLLKKYNQLHTLQHSLEVAEKSKQLAHIYNVNPDKAYLAGILHDISAIIPNNKRIEIAESLSIDIFQEERIFPMIIHQKLSKEIGKRILVINDEEVLCAVSCHTTLHANPSTLDMIVFISDKIKWDQSGIPPYIDIIENNLKQSLESATFAFIKYLIDNKSSLKVIHPWLIEAYNYFILK